MPPPHWPMRVEEPACPPFHKSERVVVFSSLAWSWLCFVPSSHILNACMSGMTPIPLTRAFVRGVADTFADCVTMAAKTSPISVPAAKEQHAAYVSLLRKLLPSVHTLPPDNNHPDCCFVEDTAVVVPGTAVVVSRPGAPSRMNEVQPVAQALQQVLHVTPKRIQAPGTLEGGDVLRVGHHLLVGLTKRTNPEGVHQLQQAVGKAYAVHSIPVAAGLHLKSAVTALDDSTFLYSGDVAGKGIIQHLQQLEPFQKAAFVEVPDAPAANVLQIGPNIVMQLGCKETESLLASLCKQRGLQLHKLPRMSEFIKADGSLTCLSIIC